MSKKRGKMNFNPDNPNKLDKEIADIAKGKPSKEQLAEYKRLRRNVMAKARRLQTAKNRDAWIALGGLEIEQAKKEGRRVNTNVVNPFINAKEQLSTNPSKFATAKDLEKSIKKMKEFTKRGGEFSEIEKAKDRIIKSLNTIGYNTPDLPDIIRYIEEKQNVMIEARYFLVFYNYYSNKLYGGEYYYFDFDDLLYYAVKYIEKLTSETHLLFDYIKK